MNAARALALSLALFVAFPLAATAEEPDPLEPMNRRIFWFNEKVDRFFLEPVAKGWDFILPDLVQTSVRNVFDNAGIPVVFLIHEMPSSYEVADYQAVFDCSQKIYFPIEAVRDAIDMGWCSKQSWSPPGRATTNVVHEPLLFIARTGNRAGELPGA